MTKINYRQLFEDDLDSATKEVLAETAELSGEMGTQLYNFSNMLQSFLMTQNDTQN